MTAAIKVEHLSKAYKVGDLQVFDTLRDRIGAFAGALFRRGGEASENAAPQFHLALDDISFEVNPGEVLGIIGHNGAGKSTLLKVLSRITEPTSGIAYVRGRVAPLLEVGTGFNIELTGRENIFVNGTLLGMSRAEIDARFDEIVEFAGIGKYIDTPVKRYSSGMIVRLGFAIAAHLEPEIMVVDEVLAVGDAAFQRRCLGKLNEQGRAGRTVLFVSHNMASIKALCDRALWIDDGKLRLIGDASEVVSAYLKSTFSNDRSRDAWPPVERRRGNGLMHFTDIRVTDGSGEAVSPVLTGQPVCIELDYKTAEDGRTNGHVQVWLANDEAFEVTKLGTVLAGTMFQTLEPEGTIICRIPRFPFAAGTYSLRVIADLGNVKADEIPSAATFEVANGDFFPGGVLPPPQVPFLCDHEWDIRAKTPAVNDGRTDTAAAPLAIGDGPASVLRS